MTSPAKSKAAAPAINDPVAEIVAKIDAQGAQIARQGATITTLEAKQALHERKSRVLEALRASAEEKARTRPDPLLDERMRRQNADIDEASDAPNRIEIQPR